jgi:hypothetical protein
MEAAADCVGFHANSYQIIAREAVQSVFAAYSHIFDSTGFAGKNSAWWTVVFAGGFAFFGVFVVVKTW